MTKGVYVLVVSANRDIAINTGALGRVEFKKGMHDYEGSAQNNLRRRIERHLKRNKHKSWHFDYPLNNGNARTLKILNMRTGRLKECKITAEPKRTSDQVKGFDSLDCKRGCHLFKL